MTSAGNLVFTTLSEFCLERGHDFESIGSISFCTKLRWKKATPTIIYAYSDAFDTILLAAASSDAAISFTAATRKFEQLLRSHGVKCWNW